MTNSNLFKALIVFGYILLSWVLVHLFAVVGIFIAVAYPILWLLLPESTICFSCRLKELGTTCPLCKTQVESKQENFPKNIRSIFLNSIILLIVALISFGLVALEKTLFDVVVTRRTVRVAPQSRNEYLLGQQFALSLEITGIETPVNTVQIDLDYDPEFLQAVRIDTSDSFATIFVQKEIDNQSGFIRLSGGLPSPGFNESIGHFGRVYFRTKKPGATEVEFLPSSLVLANDGEGTSVLREMRPISYIILPERISQQQIDAQEDNLNASVDQVETTSQEGGTKLDFTDETKVIFNRDKPVDDDATPVESETNLKNIQENTINTFIDAIYALDEFVVNIFTRLLE